MRTRQDSSEYPITTAEYEKNLITNQISWSAVTPNVGCASSRSRWMKDVVTPRFKFQQAEGAIIISPCESMDSTINCSSGGKQYELKKFTRNFAYEPWKLSIHTQGYNTGEWSPRVRIPRTPMALMTAQQLAAELALYGDVNAGSDNVLTEALAKATSADALALVTIAELDKTIDLMGECARLTGKMAKLLANMDKRHMSTFTGLMAAFTKRGYNRPGGLKRLRRDAGEYLGSLASTWLGYRYGVMATYYDIKSWVDASGSRSRARFVSTTSTSYENDTGRTLMGTNDWRDHYERTLRKRFSSIRAGVLVDPSAFTEAQRYGATRVLESTWELIPFSFVIDWIVNVGTKIAAFEGSLWVKPLGSWLTYDHTFMYQKDYEYVYKTWELSQYARFESSGTNAGTVTELCRWRKRVANPRMSPIPPVQVKMNGKRVLDALSLLTTNVENIRRFARL